MSSPKLLSHPAALCNIVKRIAVEAGDLTLDYFDEAGVAVAAIKEDGSPVTMADRAAEALIEKALLDVLPDVPVVGEEAFAGGRRADLSGVDYFWLVDPLDGTKEFVSGSGEYTVNIALIHKGAPVLGAVYAPVKGELYAGHGEGTAVRWLEETNTEKSITVRRPPKQGLTVATSNHQKIDQRMEEYLSQFKVEKIIKRGSSLKLCAIASGKADLYPRFGKTCEWDTAAGHAVLLAAGGNIVDLTGKQLVYGGADPGFENPEFVAHSSYVDLTPPEDM